MQRRSIKSGTIWEDKVGYSRVVLAGPIIEVSGTVAADENGIVHPGNAGKQTRFILEKISQYLAEVGASLQDVTRTRIYLTDVNDWPAVTAVHAEYFGQICPASTLIEVSRFITDDALVEIEVSAYKAV